MQIWAPGKHYKFGHTVEFGGEKYQVLKTHTSDDEAKPGSAPALYGKPDKFAQVGAGWYETDGLMGSDMEVEARRARAQPPSAQGNLTPRPENWPDAPQKEHKAWWGALTKYFSGA
ncbi:hypothetical protein BC834DRAFT_969257 [Gloeopeniophorella convolvens]|nr:hypothetical protein BC834DRAFT_969257 [Gloeopeniophorella convolvens]